LEAGGKKLSDGRKEGNIPGREGKEALMGKQATQKEKDALTKNR